jgi:glycosyltransferase involved in cell wall biosynthesis
MICDSSTGGNYSDSALDALAAKCALGVHRVPMRRLPGLSDIRVVRQIGKIVRAVRPDILHGHGAKGAAYARILPRRTRVASVYTPHGGSLHYSPGSLRGGIYLTIERLLQNRTDGIVFESDYARRAYEANVGALRCKSRVIHNGLFEAEFEHSPDGSPTHDFLFIGELRDIKGVHVFLDAIELLARDVPLQALVVGDGDQRENLIARINASGLSGTVALQPSIHPATEAFARARCMVVPSLAESLPYIVLECIAAGVPLIATNVGGIPEIFGPLAGRLLPSGDARALADAMQAFLENQEAAKSEASELRRYVKERFNVSRMATDTMGFYGDLLPSS